MKSFKQYVTEATVLMDLINKHDDPFSFLAAAMDAISNGTLKLKERGLANARELVAAWNKVKKKKIKLKEATEHITEGRRDLVKGWTFKNKIATSTNDYDYYHIQHVIREPRKFGLDKKKILKIIEDSAENMDVPNIEAYVEDQYEALGNGIVDNDVYIEEYLKKKGYCMFVVDKTHGSIEGWDAKSCKLGAKAVDDNYLPFERDGFKLFEVKPIKGRRAYNPSYITNKLDWNNFVEGKKAGSNKSEIGSTMAQFRESVEYVIWGIPPKDEDETLLLTTGRDGKRITKKSDAMKLLKLLVTKHGVKKARIQELDVEVDPSDMFRNPFG